MYCLFKTTATVTIIENIDTVIHNIVPDPFTQQIDYVYVRLIYILYILYILYLIFFYYIFLYYIFYSIYFIFSLKYS